MGVGVAVGVGARVLVGRGVGVLVRVGVNVGEGGQVIVGVAVSTVGHGLGLVGPAIAVGDGVLVLEKESGYLLYNRLPTKMIATTPRAPIRP
jgi:hypothetical protein